MVKALRGNMRILVNPNKSLRQGKQNWTESPNSQPKKIKYYSIQNVINARGHVFRCFQQHSTRSVTSSNTQSTNWKPELEKQRRGNIINYHPLSITRWQEKETESTNKNLSHAMTKYHQQIQLSSTVNINLAQMPEQSSSKSSTRTSFQSRISYFD